MRFRFDDGPALEVVAEVLQTEDARLGLIKELRLKEVDPDAFQTDPLCVTWPEATQVPECNRGSFVLIGGGWKRITRALMRSVPVPVSRSVLTHISAESRGSRSHGTVGAGRELGDGERCAAVGAYGLCEGRA